MAEVAEEQLTDAFNKLKIFKTTSNSNNASISNNKLTATTTNPIYEVTDKSNLHELFMKKLDIKETNTTRTTATITTVGITEQKTTHTLIKKSHYCRKCNMRNRTNNDMDDLQQTLCNTDFFKKNQHHCTSMLNGGIQKQPLKNTIMVRGKRRNVLRAPLLGGHHSSASCNRCLMQQQNVDLEHGGGADCKDVKSSHKSTQVSLAIEDCCKLVAGRLQDLPDFNVCFCKLCKKTQKLPNNNTIKRNNVNDIDLAGAAGGLSTLSSSTTANNFSQLTISSSNNNNTSCSQQAGNGMVTVSSTADTSDDVTINELACYFDHLVYIPKKMSQMAEMMYI